MSDVKTSWILGVYNKQSWLSESLASIANQSQKDFEVIIVDDCSTDYSPDVIDYWVKRDSRFRSVKNDMNKGIAYTYNRATSLVTSPIIIVAAADDTYNLNRGEWTLDYFKKHKNIDLVYFPFYKTYFDLVPWEHKIAVPFDAEVLKTPKGQFIGHGFSAYRKSVGDKVKYREELKHGCDHAFLVDVYDAGFKFGWEKNHTKIAGNYRFTPKMVSMEFRNEIVEQDEKLFAKEIVNEKN